MACGQDRGRGLEVRWAASSSHLFWASGRQLNRQAEQPGPRQATDHTGTCSSSLLFLLSLPSSHSFTSLACFSKRNQGGSWSENEKRIAYRPSPPRPWRVFHHRTNNKKRAHRELRHHKLKRQMCLVFHSEGSRWWLTPWTTLQHCGTVPGCTFNPGPLWVGPCHEGLACPEVISLGSD